MSGKCKRCITTITGKVIPTKKDWILPPTRLDINALHFYLVEFLHFKILLDIDTEMSRIRLIRIYEGVAGCRKDASNIFYQLHEHCKKHLEVYNATKYYNKDTRENCVILHCREYKHDENNYPTASMEQLSDNGLHWLCNYKVGGASSKSYHKCKVK